MPRNLILLPLAAQLLYLAGLATQREHLVRTGESVFLRTVPVDPRDLFRGDYVNLRYDVNSVAADALRGEPDAYRKEDGSPVFAALEPMPGSDDLYRLDHLTDQRPMNGPYLAGETVQDRSFWRPAEGVAARYGIEKLFVEQGRGLEIEDKRGQRDGLQIPLEVELAVGGRGRAAIRGYRWSPIGIELEMVRFDRRTLPELRTLAEMAAAEPDTELRSDRGPQIRSPEVRIVLHNVSDEVRWIVDPGDHCSFELSSADWGDQRWTPADSDCDQIEPAAEKLHRLGPGETYAATLDLDRARWYLEAADGEVAPIARVGDIGTSRFRLVYRPDPTWSTRLPVPEGKLWLTELPSPAFTAIGRVD